MLLAFKAGISNWNDVAGVWDLGGWQPGVPVCTWGGIQCSPFVQQGSRVTAIELACHDCPVPIKGSLLPSLQQLQYLQTLHLSNNSLSGPLPPEWGEPGSFPALTELNVNNNQLTGPFPAAWGVGPAFNSLYNLQIANNRLTGTFPASFARTNTSFLNLLQLNIGGNQFSGPLPTYMSGMTTMSSVGLQDNHFTGTLPAEWGAQASVEYGSLNSTQALQYLWLHGNDLSGTIPDSWAAPHAFPVLQELTLGNNPRLTGTLPSSWGASNDSVPQLQRVNVSNTGMWGPLPDWGPYPAQLTDLDISGNNFSGTVPASWAELGELQRVVMQPGNPGLCTFVPTEAPFSLCAAGDFLCQSQLQASNWTTCQTEAAQASSGSGSFPVLAVALPLALVGAAVLLAAGCWVWRRQRSRRVATKGDLAQQPGGKGKEALDQDVEVPSPSLPPSPPYGAGMTPAGSLPNPKAWMSMQRSHNTSSNRGSTPHSTGCGFGSGDEAEGGGPVFSDVELQVLPDWQIAAEDIQIMKRPDGSDWRLGSGGFGTVYKALHNGVQPVAVKVLSTAVEDLRGAMKQAAFAQEISILRACRNANILQFQGACVLDSRLVLVTEYMEGGNLAQNLAAKKVSWYRRGKKIALDVARALVYLHSRRIVHLDIKSANVLLQRDGTAKLGDVGLAKIMSEGCVSGSVGTLAWSAPELLMGRRCGAKADVFSFGVVLWEICTGELPQRGQMRDPSVPEECPPEVWAIMQRCFSLDPAARPTATELVELLMAAPAPLPSGSGLSAAPSLQLGRSVSATALSRTSTADAWAAAAAAAEAAAAGMLGGDRDAQQPAARPPLSRPPSLPRQTSPFGRAELQAQPWEDEEQGEAVERQRWPSATTAVTAAATRAAHRSGQLPPDLERGDSLTSLSPFHRVQ